MKNNQMKLAFVHIHKAAGTTLIYLLRRNFFLRYMDVRPWTSASNGLFSASDLGKCLRMNPFLRCIAGHSVRVYSDLHNIWPDVQYVTILRNPVERMVSQLFYNRDYLNLNLDIEWLLKDEKNRNRQTKMIAGEENLERAKEYLTNRFRLVGIVEQFDEFLLHLSQLSGVKHFDPGYETVNVSEKRNQARSDDKKIIFEKYLGALEEQNSLDIELYQYAKDVIVPKLRQTYVGEWGRDLAMLKSQRNRSITTSALLNLDYAIRKIYYEPILGRYRVRHGLPYSRGAY